MSVLGPKPPEPAKRVSHESLVLTELRAALADLPVVGVSGQGGTNKFGIAGWDLSALQLFQFGDLRIELPETTLVVEAESAGGVGNLVKYWPLLRSDATSKRFLLLHLYLLGSDGDYIAHRKLWAFLVDRMTVDLTSVGVRRPERWDAQLFTYRKGDRLDDVIACLRGAVLSASASDLPPATTS